MSLFHSLYPSQSQLNREWHTAVGNCQPPPSLNRQKMQQNASTQMNLALFTCFWGYFRIPTRHLHPCFKIYSPTSVKMRIFKTKTYYFHFIEQSPNTFYFALCMGAQKGKTVFLPLVTKQDHLLSTCCSLSFTLILFKVWKRYCLSAAQGRDFPSLWSWLQHTSKTCRLLISLTCPVVIQTPHQWKRALSQIHSISVV